MKRREFLNNTSKAVALGSILQGTNVYAMGGDSVWGQLFTRSNIKDNDRVLVIIRLAGGNDGLNTLIPLETYSILSGLRSNIIIPEKKILPIQGKNEVGLHPSLSGIQNLYSEGKINFIQGVGYPEQNFSHFRSTDIWLSGSNHDEFLNTGVMGRYLDKAFPEYPTKYPSTEMPDPLAIHIASTSSPFFQGPSAAMSVSITNDREFYELTTGVFSGNTNNAIGKELKFIRQTAANAKTYSSVIKNAANKVNSQNTYPNEELANKLKIIARLIAGGLKTKVYMVDMGGFDTHSDQVNSIDTTIGTHANLLSRVSEAIHAFQKDLEMQKVADKVIGMTISEFGRRIISNGSTGSDHGSSAPMIIFGSNVQNGIIGVNPTLKSTFNVNDNLNMQYDYRSVYASVMQQWFCLDDKLVEDVLFKNYQKLPIIKTPAICDLSSTGGGTGGGGGVDTTGGGTGVDTTGGSSTGGTLTNGNTTTGTLNSSTGAAVTGSTSSINNYVVGLSLDRINCSPNPFTDKVNIEVISNGEYALLQVFNTSGQVVATIHQGILKKGPSTFQWRDVEFLPSGFYYCRFENGNYQNTITLQKVK